MNVLYLEDNDADVKALRRHLGNIPDQQFELKVVQTHAQALKTLRVDDYDLAVLDYRLGKQDGLETLREVRGAEISVPVIMLTGKGNEQLAAESMRQGADDYLAKDDLTPTTLEYSIGFSINHFEEEQAQTEEIEKLERKAEVDELTGLYNRRAFKERLEEEIKRANRYGSTLSLMILDLDQFKPVNDQYGHLKGDEMLRKTGEIIRDTIRDTDVAVRYGGDEFCVIVTETHVDRAKTMGRRLCRTLKNSLPEVVDGEVDISCSIGLAQFDSNVPDAAELIHAADKAMFTAKEMGGDQVFIVASYRDTDQRGA